RNATRFPRSVPSRYAADGSPNGVATFTSSRSVTPAMSYKPDPPMMPICARCIRPLSSNHLLYKASAILLANVAGADGRIVIEEDQMFAIDGFAQEPLLERERVHRKQIERGNPIVLDVRFRGD